MKHMKRLRILLPLMIVCMLIIGISPASAETVEFLKDTDNIKITSTTTHKLADGVYEGEVKLINNLNAETKALGEIDAHVILIKPYAKVSFKPIIPNYYEKDSTRETRAYKAANWTNGDFKGYMTVSQMTAQYATAKETGGSVLAAINGDFSLGGDTADGSPWTYAPRGSVIMEGNKIAHTGVVSDEFYFGRSNAGAMNIVQHTTTDTGFQEAICGPAYILRNGTLFGVDNENTPRQRTGIGIKNNGDILWICVTKENSESGISVKQLAELMRNSGCWNGINMDGGASTTMLTKRAGESTATRKTAECKRTDTVNGERLIPNALMLVLDETYGAAANKVPTTTGSSIKTDKTSYKQGEPINVTASSDQEGAWVAVYKDGEDYATESSICWYNTYGSNFDASTGGGGTWCWENGATYNLFTEAQFNGGKSLGAVGSYKAYVLSSDRKKLAETSFEITENPDAFTMTVDGRNFNVGDAINVTATAPTTDAWVGLYKKDETAGDALSLRWYYVTGDKNGSPVNIADKANEGDRKESITPGEYKIILFKDGGYDIASTIDIIVDEQYNITYMYGDDTLTGITPATYSHNAAQTGPIALPATVDKPGHTFLGWYDNPELTGSPVTAILQGSTGDKTIYGKFDRHSYAVSFDTDGGSAVADQTVFYGDKAAVPAAPEKADMYFLGWVTEKNGTVPFDFNTPITQKTTVYALWSTEAGMLVSFDSNGGSSVIAQMVPFNGKVVKPADPTKPGYSFDKWVKADGSAYDFNATVTGVMTLKAVWKANNYTITFNSNGGSAVANKTYNVETAAFDLPKPTRSGYEFAGWKDAAGKSYTTIAKGTTGNLSLTAQWKRVTSVITDKDVYVMGEGINVNAYTEASGAWVGLYKAGERPDASGGTVSYYWEYVDGEYKGEYFNILLHNGQKTVTPGNYVIHLVDANWGVLASKNITIKENPNPAKGTLNLSGFSRDDKTYGGKSKSDHGKVLHEFFYGDGIFVAPTVSGSGVDGAWVGVLSDDDYASGNTKGFIGKNWFYVSDMKGQTVNLNYVAESAIVAGADKIPYGLNYWVVLVSDSGSILDAVAFNYRTYNMDWYGAVWSETATKNLLIETDWSSRLANGTEQKPSVTIKRVNGHFGLTRDASGKLVEITEEILKEGKDYTLQYPASSKDIGSYKINVTFPSSGSEYNYLSTAPSKYGLQDGIAYYLTSSANDHVIQYVLNGGVNHEDNPALYQTGTAIKLKAPAKAGFVFGGWYTTADFKDGTMIETIPASATSEFTLYAKWIDENDVAFKIQYVLSGGDNNQNNPIGYTGGTDITLRPAKKAGHNFEGWFFDSAFTKPADTIKKGTTGNLTLYAKFTKKDSNQVVILTNVKGGSISGDYVGKKGDQVVVTYKPNRGYVLSSVTVDGVAVDITKFPTSYTFDNVTADHEISVVFKIKLGKVTLKSIKTGDQQIGVSWKAVSKAKEYKIYRSTKKGSGYKLIGKTSELSYTDSNVKYGKKYFYKVAAYANGVTGTKSAYKSIKASKAMPKITLKSVVAKDGKVTAKWSKVKGADKYNVYRSADNGKTYTLVLTTKKTSNTSKVLTAKKYKYKVQAVQNGFNGKMSGVKNVVVLAKTKGLKATSKGKTVTLKWDATKNAAKYAVFKSVDGGKTYKKVLVTNKKTVKLKDQKAGKTFYKVRAVKGTSYGKFTDAKSVKIK